MLRTLRAATKTKLAGVIIGALVLAFALWGVNDIFQANINTAVAEVGGTEISTLAFDRELRTRMRVLGQQMNTALTIDQARALGLDQIVLGEMVSRAALDEVAGDLGLTASDEAVRTRIQTSGGFSGADGAFSYPLFLQTLQQGGISEETYVELTRKDIARTQYMETLGFALTPPEGVVRLIFDYLNETRVVDYVVLSPADAGEDIPEPSQEQLAQFHMAHPELFSAPEYRAIEYVRIGPEQIAEQFEITEEDLRAEYEAMRATFDRPELREIQQIGFPDEMAAAEAAARLNAGEEFAAIAIERGLSEDDIDLGTQPATGLAPALADAAFSIAEGEATAPVQGPFGWVILNVRSVTPAVTSTFDEIRETLHAGLVATRGQELVIDLANAFEDERASGATLGEAATSLGIDAFLIEAIDRQGLGSDGLPAGVDEPTVLEQAFVIAPGDESFLLEGADGAYYAVGVNNIMPSALRPLDTIRAEVHDSWLADARANALQARATMLADEARNTSLSEAAASIGRVALVSMPLGRDSTGDVFGPALLQQIFSVPQDGIVSALASNGEDFIVARVNEIIHLVPDMTSPDYSEFERSLGQQMSNDLIQGLAGAASAEVGVTTYPAALDTLLNGPLL